MNSRILPRVSFSFLPQLAQIVNHQIDEYYSSYSATQPQRTYTMHNLIYSTLANLPAVPFTLVLVTPLYLTPTVIGFTAMITLVLYCLEFVSAPSPYLGQLVKECAAYLGARLDAGHHHAVAVLLRMFLQSNQAMLAVIFGLVICPTMVASGLLAVLGFATALDVVIYLPLAAALPMIGWKTGKMLYPYARDLVGLPFLIVHVIAYGLVRCLVLAYERINIAISHWHQRKAAQFFQNCMTSQHCTQGHWNCQQREHWPNPSGHPHPLCSAYQSPEFPFAAHIPYWGDSVVYFRHEQHIRQLLLELDWTMCRGANRHLYVTPADVQYECQARCPIPLQQPIWARPPVYY